LWVNFTALIPIDELNAIGNIQSARWNFGDGTVVVDTDSTGDDIGQTTAKHRFVDPGHYTVTLEIDGDGVDPALLTTEVHVERGAPDTGPGAPSHQLIVGGFVGSFAAPLDDAGDVVQTLQEGAVNHTIRVRQAQETGVVADVALAAIPSGIVPQSSKRDMAGFDIDRQPMIFQPNGSDFHLMTGDLEDSDFDNQLYLSGDGSVGLPWLFRTFEELTEDERTTFAGDNSPGEFAEYAVPTVGGKANPDRFRFFTTLGGSIFHPDPAKVGDFNLQTGRVEP
ncbi:MAG: PKD domain-containing protein, partial [Verrucomicrobiae bacterium]|nr:PKD domain-containing protein [Verrucomicrobiae bacterium]